MSLINKSGSNFRENNYNLTSSSDNVITSTINTSSIETSKNIYTSSKINLSKETQTNPEAITNVSLGIDNDISSEKKTIKVEFDVINDLYQNDEIENLNPTHSFYFFQNQSIPFKEFTSENPENIPYKGGPSKLFVMNGIKTELDDAENYKDIIESKSNKDTTLIYNETKGSVKDGVEAVRNYLSKGATVSEEKQALKLYYDTLKSGTGVKIVAHSQGAQMNANVLNSLREKLLDEFGFDSKKEKSDPNNKKALEKTAQYMSQVQIITFGGFVSQEDFPQDVQVLNIKSRNDFIPELVNSYTFGNVKEFVSEIRNNFRKEDIDKQDAFKGFGSVEKALKSLNIGANFIGVTLETLIYSKGDFKTTINKKLDSHDFKSYAYDPFVASIINEWSENSLMDLKEMEFEKVKISPLERDKPLPVYNLEIINKLLDGENITIPL